MVYQLIDLYHQTVQTVDRVTRTCLVSGDIDKVWHKGLFFEMQQKGFHGKFFKMD